MPASPFVHTEAPNDLALEGAGTGWETDARNTGGWSALRHRIPRAWLGVSGYVAAGIALGLLLIVALSLMGGDTSKKTRTSAIVTDNVVHLHARDIGESCWRGAANASSAKMNVSLEVGLDGKVRSALAVGASATMRGCVESHVKAWAFLPQATASQMVLPFEIDPR